MVRAAVIGVGYLGRFHAQKYKHFETEKILPVSLVGVFDANLENSKKVSAELSVRSFETLDQMWDQVDAVTVATSTPFHFEIAKKALLAGKHVNVEKPICLRTSESEELVNLARSKGKVLAVGHSERFSPVFRHFQQAMRRPRFVEFQRLAPFNTRGSDVSVVHDLMIHDLDLLLSLERTNCKLVSCSAGSLLTDGYDWATATFEFASGMGAVVSASRLAPAMTRTVRAYDSHSQYFGNFQTSEAEVMTKGADGSPHRQTENFGKSDNLLLETQNFIEAILGKTALKVSGEDGSKALHLAAAIVSNLETQKSW